MTDLTLNEYEGVSGEELRRLLKETASKIGGSDSPENYFQYNPTSKRNPVRFHFLTVFFKKIVAKRTKAIGTKFRPLLHNSILQPKASNHDVTSKVAEALKRNFG